MTGLEEMIGVFRELEKPWAAGERLDGVLRSTFLQTQADVNVLSGSLKASGRSSSELTRDSWEGEITYGGASVPHDVEYAIFHERDLPFMPGYEAGERIEEALDDWWRGATR